MRELILLQVESQSIGADHSRQIINHHLNILHISGFKPATYQSLSLLLRVHIETLQAKVVHGEIGRSHSKLFIRRLVVGHNGGVPATNTLAKALLNQSACVGHSLASTAVEGKLGSGEISHDLLEVNTVNEALADNHITAHRLESSEQLRVLTARNKKGVSFIPVLNDVDGLDTAGLAELNDSHTNRGGGVVLDDEITRSKSFEVCKKSVGDTGAVEKGSRNLSRDAFGSTHDSGFGNNNLLTPSTYTLYGSNLLYPGKA